MRDPQELADSIIHLYLSLVRYQRSRSQAAKKQTGQSGRRMAILRCLLQSSPRSVGEIGRYLYVSDATVSRILDDMETRGYVSRRRCSKDSRRVLVEPTEAGRDLVARQIKNADLVAPFAGTVMKLDISAGEFAAPGAAVLLLADTSTWQVETTDLTELNVAEISEGSPVAVTLDAIPDLELPGRVSTIAQFGESRQGDIVYTVNVILDRQDPRLRWNMTAKVVIESRDAS